MRLFLSAVFLIALLPDTLPAAPIENPISPAGPNTQCPNLTVAPDGTLHLTYYGPGPSSAPQDPNSPSPSPKPRALWHTTLPPNATAFSPPRPIVTNTFLMENWADFASLCVGTDGALTAQWFQTNDSGSHHSYYGWYSRSTDAGRTWRTPARLGHEFVAIAPLSQGCNLAVWLESVRSHDAHNSPNQKTPPAPYAPSMKLMARLLAPDGTSLGDWTVDPDVCSCCQNTVAVLPGDRVFVAYRGHSPDEIRDNKSTIFDLTSATWTTPSTLRDDNWKIAGCPVNGPAADSRGSALAVAWFTAAENRPRVYARHSVDAGATFTPPAQIDLGNPIGRLETVLLPDRSAIIIWLETKSEATAAGLYARRLFPNGKLSAPQLLTPTSQARASGVPRAALLPNGHVLVAYTQTGDLTQVRTLTLDPAPLLSKPPQR